MASLSQSGVRVAALEDLGPDSNSVALTFDDGFANLMDAAIPALLRQGWTATIFVVADWVGRDNSWASQPAGIPRLPLLDWHHLRDLQTQGFSIGAHSSNHPRLDQVSPAEAEAEISQSRMKIEDRLGAGVATFAWPYGAAPLHAKSKVAAQYSLAVGTRLSYLSLGDDRYELPRLDSYYLRGDLAACFSVPYQGYLAGRRWMRQVRQWASR